MADKEFLEQMLSMLPEEFQDIYDDTIPEAKKIRKKMRDKNYKSMHLCCYVEKTDEVKVWLLFAFGVAPTFFKD